MRQFVLIAIGAILILPTLRTSSRLLRKPPRPIRRAVAEQTWRMIRNVYAVIAGTSHTQPDLRTFVSVALFSSSCIWLIGLVWYLAVVFGLVSALGIYLRCSRTRKRRKAELAESWPGYLEQTRAKMLSSSRSLSYVIFENSGITSVFFGDLIQHGRREFETSGNLQKAVQTLWRSADNEEVTSFVCAALCDTVGSTSSQIENQLSIISGTIRSRNALKEETNSRLAGVRTARLFILIIPVGMALAGVSFAGSIRPFLTGASILQMMVALFILGLCWYWSNKLMSFPSWPAQKLSNSSYEPQVLI